LPGLNVLTPTRRVRKAPIPQVQTLPAGEITEDAPTWEFGSNMLSLDQDWAQQADAIAQDDDAISKLPSVREMILPIRRRRDAQIELEIGSPKYDPEDDHFWNDDAPTTEYVPPQLNRFIGVD
jgi:hypothetical protein